MANRYIVIMAGGRGERFWPQSRNHRPKHLLPIVGDKAMLRQTIERLGLEYPVERIFVITNSEQASAVAEVCSELPKSNIIAEPIGRDTAAAVGLATLVIQRQDPSATFAILPADHVIHDEKAFQCVLEQAFRSAEAEDALVTVGIDPSYPATGYGYIQKGSELVIDDSTTAYQVQAFKEKPDAETAEKYVHSGDYFWNAGMFFWRVGVIRASFEKHAQELWKALLEMDQAWKNGSDIGPILEQYYPRLPKISVDYAIMEKALKVLVVKSTFDWDDVGEWPAIERHFPKDSDENVTRGEAVYENASGNIVYNNGKRLIALVGVDDLIVVETDDAVLVCSKSKAQEIKQLVKKLGNQDKWKSLL